MKGKHPSQYNQEKGRYHQLQGKQEQKRMLEILAQITGITKSEAVSQHILAGEKVKPLVLRLPSSIQLRIENLAGKLLGREYHLAFDYRYSLDPITSVPDVFAVLETLGRNRDASLLYVAPSYGLAMRMIIEAGYKNIIGIDNNKKAVKFCQQQGLDVRLWSDSYAFFPEDTFDMIILKDSLVKETNLDPNLAPQGQIEFLNTQYKTLKPCGVAVFTTTEFYKDGKLGGVPDRDVIEASLFGTSKGLVKIIKTPQTLPYTEEKSHIPSVFAIWYLKK